MIAIHLRVDSILDCSCTLLQSRGADPSIRTENYDPYLSPGKKLPIDVALDDDEIRSKLCALDKKYAKVSGHRFRFTLSLRSMRHIFADCNDQS
jgi:hypothetical protein